MEADEINRTTDLLSLVEGSVELRKVGGYHVGPCPFCGGRDRFTIKHTTDGDRWHCRGCGGGKYHTAIDYVMRRDGCDFKTALRALGGDVEPGQRAQRQTPREKPAEAPKIELPTAEWQLAAWNEIVLASGNLLLNPLGEPAREYLTARGLHQGTWMLWDLGCAVLFNKFTKRWQPAIVMPWLDSCFNRGTLMAVKYRFLSTGPDGRYDSRKGGHPWLYGLQYVTDEAETLFVTEGEFNAMSLSQTFNDLEIPKIAAVSIGGEKAGDGQKDLLRALTRRFKNVYVWADKAERAAELGAMVKGQGCALRSVKHEGVELDANELLQRGLLNDFLTAVLDGQPVNSRREDPAEELTSRS